MMMSVLAVTGIVLALGVLLLMAASSILLDAGELFARRRRKCSERGT
jgi:hypothetical protein